MDKRYLFPLSCGVIAAVLTVLLLWPDRERPPTPEMTRPGAVTMQTAPTDPEQTRPADPAETTAPEETTTPTIQTRPTDPEPTDPTEPEQTRPVYTEPEPTEPPVYDTIPFPVELEGGMLTVRSIFTYSGMDPDADWAFGESIAGIQLTNTSDEYLRSAEVTVILADGTALTFQIEDVPAGKTVMAFAQEHKLLADPDSCEDIYGDAEFTDGDPLAPDLVELRVSGTEITLKNVSGRDLTNLNVTCHGLLDESLFGGTAYHYTIASLPAGGSTVIHAVDCLLGMAEVVRVEMGD